MCGKPFFLLVKIVLVDLVSCEVKASVPGGDPTGTAPKVGVQDFVAWFGVVLEHPGVESDGLLGWVDPRIVLCSLRCIIKNLRYSSKPFGQICNFSH